MNRCARLGLGTVQWGMDYGVANQSGRPASNQVGKMLDLARTRGVVFLDTAYAYGDAERMLGEQEVASRGFQTITKTKPQRSSDISEDNVSDVIRAFHESLGRLRCERVYGLLVHHADELVTRGGQRLWEALEESKVRGYVQKIGVSVYRPSQLEDILGKYQIDLVQLPFNIYDQRFKRNGALEHLKQMRIEVHARSIFLQGLLLMSSEELPAHFAPIRDHHRRLHGVFREAGITPLQGCMYYCFAETKVDRLIIGCETVEQLSAITSAANDNATAAVFSELGNFALVDEGVLNPGAWPR